MENNEMKDDLAEAEMFKLPIVELKVEKPDETSENKDEPLKEALKTEFPLSGGEPNITFFAFGDDENDKPDQDEKVEKKSP